MIAGRVHLGMMGIDHNNPYRKPESEVEAVNAPRRAHVLGSRADNITLSLHYASFTPVEGSGLRV